MRQLPCRQVHLDFHTSGYMDDVAGKFEKKQFQSALIEGHVESITVFGKCHHGYHYFPTKVGTVHPGLEPGRDFSGEMMEACHEIGVYAPLYLTLGWSQLDAKEHPSWIARNRDGSYQGYFYDFGAKEDEEKPESSWIHLCSAGPYREYLYAMTREACERYKRLDGLMFDIVYIYDVCYCDHCIKGMREMGLDPAKEEDAKSYYQIQKKITVDGLRKILMEYHPEATLFFNSGGAEIHMPQWHYANTHFELEDLPTVWGGYDKLPMRARYFSGKGKAYLGMTGKFHRAWGEFGGYKTPEALRYECAAMLANGAGVSVGDQLHPSGKMEMETYRNIGKAYSYVEKIEEYCFGTQETSRLGVMVGMNPAGNEAVAKLLLDCQIDFDVVHSEKDFARFDTVILPDNYRLREEMGEAFNRFIESGGKVLMLGGSGLKQDSDEFAFSVPFSYLGKSSSDKDYVEAAEASEDMVLAPVLCYSSAHKIEGNGNVYAYVREPYFNRSYGRYCSHYNTPYKESRAAYPGALQSGNVLYIAHELAGMYAAYGMTYHRRYFKCLLRKLYNADCAEAQMPSQGRIHFVKRPEHRQYVLHLLYASPVQRGEVSVLEDFPTLQDVRVRIRVPEMIKSVKLIPQNSELTFEQGNEGILLKVPEVSAHQMVLFSY